MKQNLTNSSKIIFLRSIYAIFSIVACYFIFSLILTYITVNNSKNDNLNTQTIYLTTNGVHLDIVMPENLLISEIKNDLQNPENVKYYSFGWGDENFYLNVPSWSDLTFSIGFKAMFLKSSTLMHVTKHYKKDNTWIQINIGDEELKKLNKYILSSFQINNNNQKIHLPNKGYTKNDDFYRANGSYSCLKTCNSWANSAFKESGLKACYWTPFDFGLINKYN